MKSKKLIKVVSTAKDEYLAVRIDRRKPKPRGKDRKRPRPLRMGGDKN